MGVARHPCGLRQIIVALSENRFIDIFLDEEKAEFGIHSSLAGIRLLLFNLSRQADMKYYPGKSVYLAAM